MGATQPWIRTNACFVTLAWCVACSYAFQANTFGHELSFGTLVDCTANDTCDWIGKQGNVVDGDELCEEMLNSEGVPKGENTYERRTLITNIEHIESAWRKARALGDSMPYNVGVNRRHLKHVVNEADLSLGTSLVNEDGRGQVLRRLEDKSLPTYLNWCEEKSSPEGRSVCSPVKEQGVSDDESWAFAVADTI